MLTIFHTKDMDRMIFYHIKFHFEIQGVYNIAHLNFTIFLYSEMKDLM